MTESVLNTEGRYGQDTICHDTRPCSCVLTSSNPPSPSPPGDQAEFVFTVAIERFRYADMHAKGISLIHLYEDGVNLEFNIGLYFYEKLCKIIEDKPEWAVEKYAASQPEMMTAISRKKELRDKVDVNFDGKVSFLEFLLYQYRDVANPEGKRR